jgi:type I restriction enzyme S subunit
MKEINKKGWTKITFGEVCKNLNLSERDPLANGIEKYVGLEHIETGSLHINRFGNVAEGTTFTKKFLSGHVLFGKRRAYLKKAAIADFDGICSGDILVFEANEKIINKNLLPFLISSDRFFDFAVQTSAGSLSPRTKFQDLAKFEFLLPPKEQQAKLAELLWASDKTLEKQTVLYKSYQILFERYLNDATQGEFSSLQKKWKQYIVGDLGESYGGLTGKTKEDFGKGMPFVTYMNIFKNSKIDIESYELFDLKPNENQNEVKYGDIFFTGSSETPEEVGMSSVLLDDVKGYYLNSFCFGFRLKDFKILKPEYARFLFRSKYVREFMHLHAQGSTRFNLSKTTVKSKLKLTLPEVKEQELIAKNIETKEVSLIQFENQIQLTKQIQKQLINQIFCA